MRGKVFKWKNALERFAGHESTKYHRDSVVAAETVMSIFSGKQASIEIQLNQQQKQTILENRRKITPIIETIILYGRQGIPLRGHRDSGPFTFESEKNLEDNNNDGNLPLYFDTE